MRWNSLGLTMPIRSTSCLELMSISCHDIKRPLSYCTFAEWTWNHRSPVGYRGIRAPFDYHQPVIQIFNSKWNTRIAEFNVLCTDCLPSSFLIQCLSIYPLTRIAQMTNVHQAHDVYPSILNKSICHMWPTPIADYVHRIQSISKASHNKFNNFKFILH